MRQVCATLNHVLAWGALCSSSECAPLLQLAVLALLAVVCLYAAGQTAYCMM